MPQLQGVLPLAPNVAMRARPPSAIDVVRKANRLLRGETVNKVVEVLEAHPALWEYSNFQAMVLVRKVRAAS